MGWGDRGRRLTAAEHAEIQRRVLAGEKFEVAAAAVGCCAKSIQRLMIKTGGLIVRAREWSPWRLSGADREEISRGLRADDSFREIARRLKRPPSTISREVALNGGRLRYRAWRAEKGAIRRARRPKQPK